MKEFVPFFRKNGPNVRKRAAKGLFFLLLLCFSFGVLGQSSVTPPGGMGIMGFAPGANTPGRSLGFPKSNPHSPDGPGGVHFQATAVPAGRLEAVSLLYAPDQPDGRRLFIRFRDYGLVQSELYDWQLVPIARYADSKDLSCVTLLDTPVINIDTEISFFIKAVEYNKGLPKERQFEYFWANFHPALADTLIGFNLFLVDAMFMRPVESSAIYGDSAVVPRDVRGYNDGPRFSDMNRGQFGFFKKILDRWRRDGGSSYVYTDYGTATPITYDLDLRDKMNPRIVFEGYPSYQFNRGVIENNEVKEVVPLDDLNKYVEANREMVNSLNPVIFKTAELTARWAALFRAIKARNPVIWEAFIKDIKSVSVEPEQPTPRYWIPGGSVPPELEPYLPWKANQPIRVEAPSIRALPGARREALPDTRVERKALSPERRRQWILETLMRQPGEREREETQ
jgi:hypothetical protein